jgi:starch phosphorylase
MADVRENCVFTTHTPVTAGNDTFAPGLLEKCFDEEFLASLKISKEEFFALGRTDSANAQEWFGMTPFAIRLCRSANGVSEKHGEVSRALWQNMFDGARAEEVPITFVTNGVHAPTWIAPTLKAVYEKHIGANWTEILKDENAWREAVGRIPDEEIWRAHNLLKNQLIAFIRQRTLAADTGSLETIHEHSDVKNFFEPQVLTIGFARRVAAYKRWNLLLSDVPRLQRMIGDASRPVQFVFAGKAHPQDRTAKALLQNLMNQKQNGTWLQRAAFIEDYDQEVARYLVQGVDVWLNVPRRPLEASGTSGQKAAMNGGLNLSILDGWWIEGDNGENGFSIGVLRDEGDLSEEETDANDAESLYHTLETQVIPAFYEKDADGLPRVWISKMRSALATLTPQFSSDRMLKDYIEKIYGA